MKRISSKKRRIFRNLLALVLLIGLMDFLIADAFLIPENQFRRVERGNLVGPSTILGKEEIDHSHCHGMIVADAGDGVILWIYGRDIGRTHFTYREKYEDNMIVAAPGSFGFMVVSDTLHLPIVLFDNVPKAASAALDFTLTVDFNGEEFTKSYHLEAKRSAQGYFHFTLKTQADNERGDLGAEGAAINRFAYISTGESKYADLSIPVTVRFYDLTGQLIETDTVSVRSSATVYLEENGVIP